jgi:hypothetical protein
MWQMYGQEFNNDIRFVLPWLRLSGNGTCFIIKPQGKKQKGINYGGIIFLQISNLITIFTVI